MKHQIARETTNYSLAYNAFCRLLKTNDRARKQIYALI